jgi:chemotaxis protein methyltransferase CheR
LQADRRLTVWSAGCADGSELQSVGLLLQRLGALERARLVGSDVLEENVRAATTKLRVANELYAARARFEQRDLLDGGVPPGSWRLIVCRNVAIYLAPHAKAALHETLARALARDGVLLLGRTERLHDPARLGLVRVAPNAYRRPECAT